MAVQGCRVELREAVDLVHAAVNAVADRDIDQAVVRAEGDSWLGALLSQRIQARSSSSTKDDSEDGLAQPHSVRKNCCRRCPRKKPQQQGNGIACM